MGENTKMGGKKALRFAEVFCFLLYLIEKSVLTIQKLYRAVSEAEYKDWENINGFRTAENTLEAKQFFKTERAVKDFIHQSQAAHLSSPYLFTIEVHVLNTCLESLNADYINLDTHEAISIDEDELEGFNKCITFAQGNAI
jgi:hypothetical protein